MDVLRSQWIPVRVALWANAVMFWLLVTASQVAAQQLSVVPSSIELSDRFARRQMTIALDGQDVTDRALVKSQDESIAVVAGPGFLVPKTDGKTTLIVEHAGQRLEIPLVVSGQSSARVVDFRNEVEPILTRYGCNAGGCHGKASGQNGFKLSLFGFDAKYDYAEIVQRARGRRVFSPAPDASLLLQKAVNSVPHGGGKRFEIGSEPYEILRAWIAAGTPMFSAEAPTVTAIAMHPSQRSLRTNDRQQLSVVATYSDGSQRDVTRSASFLSNLEVVAKVDERGLVQTLGETGEAAIMAQYMGQVAVFRAIVPHGQPLDTIPDFQPNTFVDDLVVAKWKSLGLLPSPTCDDATFLRRVTLDLCGRLPTVDEVRGFLADSAADKRQRAIDRLLDSPDYPAFFALRWGVILRNSQLAGANQAAIAFHQWIKDSIARNEPYDQFVRGIVACAGEWQDAPAVNWLWQNRDDQLHQTTADVAQVFLGTRLQCARCHHHPYERWSQEDYFGLAGFFTRLGRKNFGEPPPYFAASQITLSETNPVTGKQTEPKFLGGGYARFAPEQDPRHGLVDWMTQPDNPFFAKALVNRMWGHFFGRGLVQEVDDLRDTNPASNPELLDALAKDFVEHKFDVKRLIRTLVSSRVYQLSSEPRPENQHDKQNFARFYARRLIAEAMLDAVDQATGHKSRFGGVAATARAVDLPHEGFGSTFLDVFDRPKRVTVCECERSPGATLAQVLMLTNSDDIESKIADGNARVEMAMKEKRTAPEIVEELYIASLSRLPDESERTLATRYLEDSKDLRQAAQDLLWSLLNAREFSFNH